MPLSTPTSLRQLTETVGQLRDERAAAESEWQAMIDAVPVAILFLGQGGTIARANRRARELVGSRHRMDDLLPKEPWATSKRLCDLVLATGAGDFMEVVDGESRSWEISANPLETSGSGSCVVLALREITERVKLAEKLRRRERLSDLGTLFHGISHRVRSSLFGVTGLIDVMQLQADSSAEHERYLELQRRQVDHILDVLDRVNQFAGPTEPNRTTGDLEPVLTAALRDAGSETTFEHLEVEVDLEPAMPAVTIDRDRLALALAHVLRNAFEHSPHGGKVYVQARSLPGEVRRWLCLAIGDEGEGIAEEHKPRVFEPFFCYPSSGHGLGLPITKRIVEDHGGRIEVADREPNGCLVTILMPVALDKPTTERPGEEGA